MPMQEKYEELREAAVRLQIEAIYFKNSGDNVEKLEKAIIYLSEVLVAHGTLPGLTLKRK